MAIPVNSSSGVIYILGWGSSGTITGGNLTLSGTQGLRVSNGALPEYGSMEWNSNFLNIGTVINGGTNRNVRIIAAATSVLLAPGGSDAYVFLAAGPSIFSGLASVARGVPVIVANARFTAQVAAKASVAAFTVGAADGTFEVIANVLVTTATTHAFTVQCTYTDESNTARTITLPFRLVGDTTALTSSIANGNGTVPYLGVPVMIRAKAATAITILTQAAGVYTSVAYNVEGIIKQTV